MKLCCYFNYAPLYRESIYRLIDNAFETQFYFGKEVKDGENSGIAKLNYDVFQRYPIEFKNKTILNKFSWRTKSFWLSFKKYDTFLITGDFVYSYIPLLIFCRILGKRVYGWGHGIKSFIGKSAILDRFFYMALNGFFTYGENGRKRLIEIGVNPQKLFVIYNSLTGRISPHTYASTIYKDHFNNSEPTLLFIGRLTEVKRLDWIIDVVKKLNENDYPCNLTIVGIGPQEQILRKLSQVSGIEEKVWFYGECYDDILNSDLIFNADLCVSPGNIGLTALHSLQYGTPVISHGDFETQMPEYETIIPYKTGILYQRGDFDDFYEKIREWLEFAKGRREEIRKNCYAMINGKWNSENQIAILKEVLLNG